MQHPAFPTVLARARRASTGRHGLAWTITAGVLCIDAVWLALAGWSVSGRGLAVLAMGLAACLAPLSVARYRHDARIAATTSFCALLLLFQAAAATLSYLVVSTNAALHDAALHDWDRALGFDWLALAAWLQGHALIQALLRVAYVSGLLQLVFVVLFLALSGRHQRLAEFMLLFIGATLVTIAASGFFPAAGAWKFYALASPDLSTLSHFEPLRDGRLRTIALETMQGLISIPSLHAAMAVLLVYAVRGTRVVLPAFALLDLAMLVSTPIAGSHYLVDVLAGVALALALVAIGRQRIVPTRVAAAIAPITHLGALQR